MEVPPAWTGITFTSKLNNAIPPSLSPSEQKLPSPFVVAIIGASRNIGAATAKAFAQAGATGLILTGATESDALVQTKEEVIAAGSSPDLKVTILGADLEDTDSAKHVADTIESTYGRLDVLVNSAGLFNTNASAFNKLDAVQIDQYQKPMAVNYIGKAAVIQAVLPLMLKSEGGAKTIVNVTSILAHFANVAAVGFNISELAINRLTESVAEAYANDGVLAYAVHPGSVLTLPGPVGMPPEARQGCVDDVGLCGAFLLWLVKERREWLSGRYLSSNWDVEELEAKKSAIVQGDLLKMRLVV